jgi:hypothetical protein
VKEVNLTLIESVASIPNLKNLNIKYSNKDCTDFNSIVIRDDMSHMEVLKVLVFLNSKDIQGKYCKTKKYFLTQN